MYIDASKIILFGSVLSALGLILGLILKAHKWYLQLEELKEELEKLKKKHEDDTTDILKENRLVCEALIACLDGLQQLGANHNVPIVKTKMESYLNDQAHK